jgi:hypothetical protein
MEKENQEKETQNNNKDKKIYTISGTQIIFLDETKLATENQAEVKIKYKNGNIYEGGIIGNSRNGKGKYLFLKSDTSEAETLLLEPIPDSLVEGNHLIDFNETSFSSYFLFIYEHH